MGRHLGEDFHLFHRVDAQVRFQVQIILQHVGGVAGLLGNDLFHLGQGRAGVHSRGCGGRSCRHRCGGCRSCHGSSRGSRCRNRLGRFGLTGGFGAFAVTGHHAEGVVDDLELGLFRSGDLFEPVVVDHVAFHRVLFHPLDKHVGKVGTEAGGKMEAVFGIDLILTGEVQILEVFRDLSQVGNGRSLAFLQRLDQDHVFDGRTQGVTGEALGVGDADGVQMLGKGGLQGGDLGVCTAAPGRGVGLVAHEEQLGGVIFLFQAVAFFHNVDETVHLAGHVGHIDVVGVEGRVGHVGPEDLALAVHAAAGNRLLVFDDQAHGAGTQDGAVAIFVKGFGTLGNPLLNGGGTQGQKAGAHPLGLAFGGGDFTTHHQDPLTASHTDPVFGNADGQGGGGAGGGNQGVGSLGLDDLGQVSRSQGTGVGQEVPVELVAFKVGPFLGLGLEEPVGDRFLDLDVLDPFHEEVIDLFKLFVGFQEEFFIEVFFHLVDEGLGVGPQGSDDDTGVVLHFLGQGKTVRNHGPAVLHLLVLHDQGDVGVFQGLDTGSDTQGHGCVILGFDTIFIPQVKKAQLTGQMDDVLGFGDLDKPGVSVGGLVQLGDIFVRDGFLDFQGQGFDEVFPVEDGIEVVLGKYAACLAGQTHGNTGNQNVPGVEVVAVQGVDGRIPLLPLELFKENLVHGILVIGLEGFEILGQIGGDFGGLHQGGHLGFGHGDHGGYGFGCRHHRGSRGGEERVAFQQVFPAVLKGGGFTLAGIHGDGVAVFTDVDVLEQVAQQPGGSDFNELGLAGDIDMLHGFDEFNRRDNLAGQQVLHRFGILGIGGGQGVGNNPGRRHLLEVQGIQVDPQFVCGFLEQRGVEGTGEVQLLEHRALGGEELAELLDGFGLAGHRSLLFAVLVGDINIGDERFPDQGRGFLFILENHHDLARLFHRGFEHEIGTLDDQAHGIFEFQDAGAEQGRVFTHGVADEIIRRKAFHGQAAAQGGRGEEDGGLGVLGGVQGIVLAEHHVQQGVAAFGSEDGLTPVHDGADVGVGVVKFFHHAGTLGALAGEECNHS